MATQPTDNTHFVQLMLIQHLGDITGMQANQIGNSAGETDGIIGSGSQAALAAVGAAIVASGQSAQDFLTSNGLDPEDASKFVEINKAVTQELGFDPMVPRAAAYNPHVAVAQQFMMDFRERLRLSESDVAMGSRTDRTVADGLYGVRTATAFHRANKNIDDLGIPAERVAEFRAAIAVIEQNPEMVAVYEHVVAQSEAVAAAISEPGSAQMIADAYTIGEDGEYTGSAQEVASADGVAPEPDPVMATSVVAELGDGGDVVPDVLRLALRTNPITAPLVIGRTLADQLGVPSFADTLGIGETPADDAKPTELGPSPTEIGPSFSAAASAAQVTVTMTVAEFETMRDAALDSGDTNQFTVSGIAAQAVIDKGYTVFGDAPLTFTKVGMRGGEEEVTMSRNEFIAQYGSEDVGRMAQKETRENMETAFMRTAQLGKDTSISFALPTGALAETAKQMVEAAGGKLVTQSATAEVDPQPGTEEIARSTPSDVPVGTATPPSMRPGGLAG